ncbi:MAG: methionine adenosyltransferase domain-containing protein [Anaerobutyricum sp.]
MAVGLFSGKDWPKGEPFCCIRCKICGKVLLPAGLTRIVWKLVIFILYWWPQPTSIMVDTFETGKIAEEKLVDMIRENFDLRPAGIIKMLDLRRPIYKQTAAYGHFGRNDLDLPWKNLIVETLKKYL